MANRVVNVRLLVSASQFNQGMLQSGTSVRVLAQSLGTAQQQAQATSAALQTASAGAAAAGAGMSAAFGYAMNTFADFDQQMSAAGAAAGLTGQQLDMLRAAAIDAGSSTSFSATEAAGAIEELAKAGVSAADITGGALTGALNLAAAGGVEVADAANIAATAMTVFGLKGKDVAHVADVLTAAANKSQASVDDVSQAMDQAALVAKQTGLTLEDTAGALALFSSQGLNGSDAGTSFKTMLMSLNPRSKEAASLMQDLGLTAYDAQGNFVGLSQYAGKLQSGLSTLSTEQRNSALQTIFGTDAIRAATVLYNAGSAGVDEWTAAVDDTGLAAETAAARTDNLNGDLERLQGAIESAILGSGNEANDVLRKMAQEATNVVNGAAALPGPMQEIALGASGIVGPTLAAVGVLGLMFNQMTTMQTTLAAGGAMSQRLATGMGFLKGGMFAAIPVIGLAAVALDLYGRSQAKAKQAVSAMTDAVRQDNGALDQNVRKLLAHENASNGVAEAAKTLGISAQDITDALTGNATAAERVTARLNEVADATSKAGEAAGSYGPGGGGVPLSDSMQADSEAASLLTKEMKEQKKAIEAGQSTFEKEISLNADLATVVVDGVSAQSAAAAAFGVTASAMKDQDDAASKLRTALDLLSGNAISATEAQDALDDKLADLKETIKENGSALESTEEPWSKASINARENRGALLDLITAANDTAEAMVKQGDSTDVVSAKYRENIAAVVAHASELGLDADAVQALIDKYALTPEEITTAMKADTTNADAGIASVQRQFKDIDGTTATVTIQYESKGAAEAAAAYYNAVAQNTVVADAYGQRGGGTAGNNKKDGGLIVGPGGPRTDSVPIMASNGEYMINAEAVKRFGIANLDLINGGSQILTPADSYATLRPVSYAGTAAQAGSSAGVDVSGVVAQLEQLRGEVAMQTAVTARLGREFAAELNHKTQLMRG